MFNIVAPSYFQLLATFTLKLACEQAHLIGKGGGATIASRRSRREEWGEEKSLFLAPFFSPASPARDCGSTALAYQVSLLAGYFKTSTYTTHIAKETVSTLFNLISRYKVPCNIHTKIASFYR